MADEQDGQERTEEPTDDRKEEFRKRGDVAHSKEFTSVLVLAGATFLLTLLASSMMQSYQQFSAKWWSSIASKEITQDRVLGVIYDSLNQFMYMIIPLFLCVNAIAILATFFQTRFNFSTSRLAPDFSRMNPIKGLGRMVSGQALFELGKGVIKMVAVGIVGGMILYSEINHVPNLANFPLLDSWNYWSNITRTLFIHVSIILLLMAAADYMFNFFH